MGLSGGVDSSVAAYLLKQQGHTVIGVFMKNWEGDDDDEYCSSRQDWLDALAVADVIGIDIEAVNFAKEYRERVFAEFVREYSAGRTPNPDVLCNSEIKFNAFWDYAASLGADTLATGHYAGIVHPNQGPPQLLRARDASKDQSYFLHRLSATQLAPAHFPLAHLHKTEVRAIAADLKLPTAQKKDSTGICFIGERPFRQFLQGYIATTPGPIVNDQGQTIGQHMGLSFYTLGQRKGIGVGGIKGGEEGAWFVAQKNLASNTLVIVQGHDHPLLLSRSVSLERCNWIAGTPPSIRSGAAVLSAKTRYRQKDAPILSIDWDADRATLTFAQAQWAVTPGQSCVLYQDEVCLGGGIISSASP